jgi:hypothetical protein
MYVLQDHLGDDGQHFVAHLMLPSGRFPQRLNLPFCIRWSTPSIEMLSMYESCTTKESV